MLPTPVKSALGTAVRALVRHPIPSSHCAWTRNVLPGSNSLAVAENLLAAYATLETSVRIASVATSVRSFIALLLLRCPWECGRSLVTPLSTGHEPCEYGRPAALDQIDLTHELLDSFDACRASDGQLDISRERPRILPGTPFRPGR